MILSETSTILEKLYTANALTQKESQSLFTAVVNGELSPEQLSGALIALKVRGETIEEITGAVLALQQDAKVFPTPDYAFADIVGTGGDGANTINISTASSLVCASLSDVITPSNSPFSGGELSKFIPKIAKHGNRSVSSKSGSSDVLTALGVNINMSPEVACKALDDIGICFLFAQQYHLGFKHAVPVRQALKTRTIFNNLGPLINPANPKRQLLGVYSPHLIDMYAKTVQQLEHEHSIVVHGSGLDEVALHGVTQIAEIKRGEHGGTIERYDVTPTDFGFSEQPLSVLEGGSPAENARDIIAMLQGKGNEYHAQAVAINTAMTLKLFGYDDIKQSASMIMEHLTSGKAMETLEQLRSY